MSLSYNVNEDGLLKLQQIYNNFVLNAIKGKSGIYRPVYIITKPCGMYDYKIFLLYLQRANFSRFL